MVETNYEAYESMPYPGSAYSDSHPSSIRPIAALMGVEPASPLDCRLLEIGCAQGANIIPMAASLPTSRFVGLDLSDRHVERATATCQALNLGNLEFVVGDICAQGPELGQFDYIIAHGVYSWLPDDAREKLMSLCSSLLAPQGVAYISHNVYPGWHRKQALRNMMLYHVRGVEGASERVQASKALLEFLGAASSPRDPSYKLWLHEEAEFLTTASEAYVFHDHLAVHNAPSYFHEFAAEAHSHNLQFVADAFLPANFGGLLPAQLAKDLTDLTGGDRVAFEQYEDFVLNRPFRKTLLCRQDLELTGGPKLQTLANVHVMTDLERTEEEDGSVTWQQGERVLRQVNEATDALLGIVTSRWPGTISTVDLFESYRELGVDASPASASIDEFCNDLFLLALNLVVKLNANPIEVSELSEQPRTYPWVRQELAEDAPHLTTIHHRRAGPGPALRVLARLADGTRDREDLLEGLIASAVEGELELPIPDPTPEQLREGFSQGLKRGLIQLRHFGLLE